MAKVFAVSSKGIRKAQYRFLKLGAVMYLGAMLMTLVGANAIGLLRIDFTRPLGSWLIGTVIIAALLLFMTAPLVGFLMLLPRKWSSTEIELDEDSIAWRQSGVVRMRIRRQEITRLQEEGDSLLVMRGPTPNKYDAWRIPKGLDEYQEIAATLFAWRPPVVRSGQTLPKALAMLLVMLVGFSLLVLSPDPWLTVLGGLFVSAISFYSYWSARQSQEMAGRLRLSFIVATGVVIIIAALKLYVLLILLR